MDEHYLYIVSISTSDNYIKVGRSKHPEKRIREMSTGTPYELTLEHKDGPMTREAAKFLEREMHKLLRPMRVDGEWFDMDAEISDIALKWRYIEKGYPRLEDNKR